MAGTLIRVLPKTDMTMSNDGTAAVETPLGMFDATIFTSVIIIARIHAKSTSSTAQTLNVFFRNMAPSVDDIAAEFVGATVGTATYTINGGTAGVQVPQIVACTGALSYKIRLLVSCSQATQGAAFTFTPELRSHTRI
jgi:hypothetical protein